jgi:hypothetical protein
MAKGPVHPHLWLLDVGGHHVLIAKTSAQAFDEFRTDLAAGADDEDLLLFHRGSKLVKIRGIETIPCFAREFHSSSTDLAKEPYPGSITSVTLGRFEGVKETQHIAFFAPCVERCGCGGVHDHGAVTHQMDDDA